MRKIFKKICVIKKEYNSQRSNFNSIKTNFNLNKKI